MLKRLLLPALIVALAFLFFHQMVLTDKILARGDTYNYFYPYWDVRNEAYRAGELPMWTPDIFMGAPLLANPQLGTYYPPNWLTAPFRAPNAIKLSILLHAMLAGLGMVALYRTTISKQLAPAITAGVVFAFGGYLGSHVEQINQLQGLAWIPLLFMLYHRILTGKHPLRVGILLSMAWAMQIFSGHTQTVFMTGVGLGIYGLCMGFFQWRNNQKILRIPRAPILLATCAVIAVALALPQLLPTLELTGMSNRGGGFNVQQATAFSLSPNTIGRALLPSYDSQLFGEYVTYLGVIGLGLALWGMVAKPRLHNLLTMPESLPPRYHKWAWIILAGVGLSLAFGRFNPLYLILAELPGFNLFRVPARWLSLFTLGMAMLAGLGVQALNPTQVLDLPTEGKRKVQYFSVFALIFRRKRQVQYFSVFALVFIGNLIFLTRFVLQVDPRDVYGDAIPQDSSVILWLISLAILLVLLNIHHRWIPYLALGTVILELFLASLILPYNDLTPPEVYLGQRFTISQLLAEQEKSVVPGRVLAMSRLFFDPGDIGALRERYDRLGMDEQSQFHGFDAVKKQEMLMPNLPMTWGIPTIDGFGGGILPTIYYSQFTSLLLPENELRTVDGRLGETLAKPECRGACIPKIDWLLFTDTRYIITDKVYDIWHDDVAYDTTMARFWQEKPVFYGSNDSYDEVRILHTAPFELDIASTPEEIQDGLLVTLTDESTLNDILQTEHTILAVTLVDSRTEDVFLQVQPRLLRLLSSDVKIYGGFEDEMRAYLPPTTHILPDDWQGHEDALDILRNEEGWVIHGDAEPRNFDGERFTEWFIESTEFIEYSDTRIEIDVNANSEAYLILNDAYYPGWKATVNGEPVPVYRANVMFRAVPVPAGESTVVFTFEPDLWRTALMIGGVLWLLASLGLVLVWRRRPSQPENPMTNHEE